MAPGLVLRGHLQLGSQPLNLLWWRRSPRRLTLSPDQVAQLYLAMPPSLVLRGHIQLGSQPLILLWCWRKPIRLTLSPHQVWRLHLQSALAWLPLEVTLYHPIQITLVTFTNAIVLLTPRRISKWKTLPKVVVPGPRHNYSVITNQQTTSR